MAGDERNQVAKETPAPKQKYVGVRILEEAQEMTLEQAQDAGLVSENRESDENGYRVVYQVEGVRNPNEPNTPVFIKTEEWIPEPDFLTHYRALTPEGELHLTKISGSLAGELALALKVRDHVKQIEDKKYSLKELAVQILNVYGIDLENINN